MLPEVSRIIDGHTRRRKGQKGPDPDKSILRASVLMLCATWELYCESLLMESVDKLLQRFSDPSDLPQDMQGQLKAAVHNVGHVVKAQLRAVPVSLEMQRIYDDSLSCGLPLKCPCEFPFV